MSEGGLERARVSLWVAYGDTSHEDYWNGLVDDLIAAAKREAVRKCMSALCERCSLDAPVVSDTRYPGIPSHDWPGYGVGGEVEFTRFRCEAHKLHPILNALAGEGAP